MAAGTSWSRSFRLRAVTTISPIAGASEDASADASPSAPLAGAAVSVWAKAGVVAWSNATTAKETPPKVEHEPPNLILVLPILGRAAILSEHRWFIPGLLYRPASVF